MKAGLSVLFTSVFQVLCNVLSCSINIWEAHYHGQELGLSQIPGSTTS